MARTKDADELSKKVVIIGAGFGGLSAALEFAKQKKLHRQRHDFDIILIDRNDFQLFTPDLYEVASASRLIHSEQELKDTICLNVRVALGKQSIGFLQAEVTGIDRAKQHVITTKGEVPYDYLLCALGSEAFYFNIPGMQEHSIALKTIDEAVAIRARLHDAVAKKDHVHAVICGGGPAGVEVAAEMRVACKNSVTGKCPAITIVEAQPTVLPAMSPRIQQRVTKRLKSLGVQLRTNFFIANAAPGAVTSKDGETIKGDVIIWTGGVKAHHTIESLGMQLTKRGQLPVRPTLQSNENEHIFAVGDAAEVPCGSIPCPQTAHEAVEQGPVAAHNIICHLIGVPHKMKQYHPKEVGYVVTLGGKQAIVALSNGWIFMGFKGWLVRKAVDFFHFHNVLPFMRACSIWYQGLKVMTKND